MPDKQRITAWVRAAQAGDGLSFVELVRSYQDVAVAYAASLLGDHHLAEDAAQEAFVEAYRVLPSLREPAAFAGWFRSIIFKHCDRLKRRKQPCITGLDAALEVASSAPSPHEILEMQEDRRSVREAIVALPEAERAVVLLYYMGEYSQVETAEFLNITPNAVKTRLYSARQRLRKTMGYLENDLQAARPSSNPDFARRVMGSVLPLQIRYLDEKGNPQKAGSTIGSRTVEVPVSDTWLIEPGRILTAQEWNTVIALMEEMQIPGLSAGRQMTDALLERLSQLDHLKYLGLEGSAQVTDAGLRHLARLPELQHLDLSCPQITDQGLDVLRRLPQIKTFKLVHQSRVSDSGLAHLAHCQNLECVNLMGTRTGDGVIKALAGKPQLRKFYSGADVTDAGLALLHQFPVFKTWQDVEISMALMEFGPALRQNFLFLRGSFTDQGLVDLVGLDGLFALNLDDRKLAVTSAGLKPLAELPHLGWLAFDATDEAMSHIQTMPRLRFLMCQDTVAGDEGFTALSRSPSIEYIWGRRCYNLTGRGFAALAAMPRLRGLSVSCKNVDDAGLSALPRFPALREFMPMDVPDDGFRHVGRCEQLEELICMYCDETTDTATGHIEGLSNLKSYQAWSTRITDRSLEMLGRTPSIERLLFYNLADVTDAGLASVAGLPRLSEVTLETLPRVTPEGTPVFPAHVRVNLVT